MILAAAIASSAIAAYSPAPTRWVATVRPEVQVISEIDSDFPLTFQAVKVKFPADGYRLESRLANDTVFSKIGMSSRENVRDMVRRSGALVGINADFFGNDGDPLGMMISGGELVSEPYSPRSVAAWGSEQGLLFDSPIYSGTIDLVGGQRIRIDGVNRSARAGEVILFTRKGGMASSKKRCTAYLFESINQLPLHGGFAMRLKTSVTDLTDIPVALSEAILMVSPERQAEVSAALYSGLTYEFQIKVTGQIDWASVKEAIGGGPRLVKNGSPSVPRDYERFAASYNARHPRSAIGYTASKEVILLVVDGRSSVSKGLTLDELASLMAKLGCVDAMNLDGGGSTTLVLGGTVLNRPSDGGLRGVANALLLFTPEPVLKATAIRIEVKPGDIRPGDQTTLRAAGSDGSPIPENEVVWTGRSGAGWIGGDGTFRATNAGKATVSAYAQGVWTSTEITVSP
ncbi:MAG: phosphodiester glycosidase family protein [Armatimonadota bacterium]|nr:phosphodiester glycosidase family protein [Armatimonadota bacterium]